MSILDSGPHVITVDPSVAEDDGYGGTQPGMGEPIEVRAYCSPLAAESDSSDGYGTQQRFQVIARHLPSGPWARIDWGGEQYVMEEPPRRFGFSRRTAHDVAVIRRG